VYFPFGMVVEGRRETLRVSPLSIIAITLLAPPAMADVAYFNDHAAFTLQNLDRGGFLRETQTFEEALMESGKAPFPDALTSGVPHSPVFPNGLAASGLTIQTNRLAGPLAPVDQPSSISQALFAVGHGAIGATSVKVGEDLSILFGIECSIDLLFDSDNLTAIGLDLSRFQAFGTAGWHIGIFDANDALIGQYLFDGVIAAEPAKNFFGVWSSTPIARINLFDLSATPSPDAVDNIEMWVPAPSGAMTLTLLLGVTLRRKRRPVAHQDQSHPYPIATA